MSLLGTPLLLVLGCVAVLIPVATVLLWSRVRGPRLVRGAAHLLMLGAGQVATVLLVAALANGYGQFYTSWGDLLGRPANAAPKVTVYGGSPDPQAVVVARPGVPSPRPTAPGPASGRMRVLGSTSWSTQSQWKTRGRVISVEITGLRSALSVQAFVYLPPQYFAPGGAHRRFPAVEVMTGYPGSALALVTRMYYPDTALSLVNEHRSVPMIYVMFSSTVAPPRDTECTDVPGGPQAETFLAAELPSAVQHGLRVQPGSWGAVGDSTGGYCAAKLGMLHPDVFAGAVSLSGYYRTLSDATTGDLWAGSPVRRHENNLEWLLAHRPAPPASLFVTISRGETSKSTGYPDTMRFLHLVRPPMHVTALIEQTGGHNFATWIREMPQGLSWLSDRVSARSARAVQPGQRG